MFDFIEIIIILVILIHIYFFCLEFFAWPKMVDEFFDEKLSVDAYKKTGIILKNQALYNGFLASGLIWTFFMADPVLQLKLASFFLSFILIAGVYGGLTINKKIFFIQALPALVALFIIIFVH